MIKPFYLLLFFLFLSAPIASTLASGRTSVVSLLTDDEYDRYKKKGDDFFKEGRYLEARRQYQNCLEVPGFENDIYAKEQIEECTKGLALRQQATDALAQNKGQEAIRLFGQLLNLNPDDAVTKTQLADYYEREGNQLFNQKKYIPARESYTQALKYTTTRQETLRLQIRTIDNLLKPSKQVGLKVATGLVAVGAGAFALLLRNDFQNKMGTLSQISQTVDPSGTGIIDNPDAYRQYNDAYNAAESAQKRNGLYKASIGIAAVATVAELYLLLHKSPKTPRATGFHWQPSSQSFGLAIRYTF
ncbi:tetratricopeptide repeat protein [Spirosoma endbachense]|uniref:Uncharacterized protein n=1 Tax=Spirosoma endbachense TaxID=2666025 RepID=A0A6P1VN48_9BACT|nr:hypothetical protein [Spirosoma endbachense]QHV94024.1 hypothetical protein GJR95_02830 [Spirosoma endbachense]